MDNWKATPWDYVLLKISNEMAVQRIRSQQKKQLLDVAWLFTVFVQQFLRWKFHNMFTELSTCLLTYKGKIVILTCNVDLRSQDRLRSF